VLQCVAGCCSALQCVSQFVEQDNVNIEINTSIARVAVRCSVLQRVSHFVYQDKVSVRDEYEHFSCCSVLQCVAACCSALQSVSQLVEQDKINIEVSTSIVRVAVCRIVLQCVVACCSAHCSVFLSPCSRTP